MGAHFIPDINISSKSLYKFGKAIKAETFYIFVIDLFDNIHDILFVLFKVLLFAKPNQIDLCYVVIFFIKEVFLVHFATTVSVEYFLEKRHVTTNDQPH